MTENLRQKILNYRLKLIETDSEKLLITYCIIIYNDIHKRKLEKAIEEDETICNKDVNNYKPEVQNSMLSSAHRSERNDIFFTEDLDRRHFLQN